MTSTYFSTEDCWVVVETVWREGLLYPNQSSEHRDETAITQNSGKNTDPDPFHIEIKNLNYYKSFKIKQIYTKYNIV